MIWIWAAIAAVIALVLLVGPEKPEAPPRSNIRYDETPRSEREPDWAAASGVTGDIAEPPAPDVDATLASDRFVIHGTVTSAESGKPVVRARVACSMVMPPEEMAANEARLAEAREAGDMDAYTALVDELQARYEGYTDTRGRFAVDVQSSGEFKVVASHAGFFDVDTTAAVSEAQPRAHVTLALGVGAKISGRVTEAESGDPAPGIEIVCDGANVGTVTTDQDGNYTVTGLAVGDYRVSLNLRGRPYQVRGRAPQQAVTVERDDDHVTGIDFVVNPAGIVWGYVYGPKDQAVERAEVVLCTSDSIVSQVIDTVTKQAPPIAGRTDKDGYYELMGVPLNQAWQIMGLSKDLAPQLSDEFLLTMKNRNVRVDLYMLPGTTVYGQVISSSDGSPVPAANIACIPSYAKFFSPLDTPQAFRDATSDDQGHFTITDLPMGEYQILAQKDGFKLAAMGERISPDGIQDIRNLRVSITPVNTGQYAVYGYVMDMQGAAIPNAELALAGMGLLGGSLDAQERKTDASGYFVFEGIDPGMLMLEVRADGYSPQSVGNVLLDQDNLIYLEATASIAGRVLVRETNRPAETFSMRTMPLSASGNTSLFSLARTMDAQSFSDADGAFSLDLAAGRYRLEASAPGLTPGRVNVEVLPGQRQSGLVIYVSETGGTIQGRVRIADGTNPQGAVVMIADGSSQLQNIFAFAQQLEGGGFTVGPDGVFEFTGLPEGAYTVTARLQNYAQAQSNPIQVRPGRSTTNVDLVLGSGGELQGYVYKDGAVETGAVITVVGNNVSQIATSDRNGFYSIDHLPAGTYMASKMSMGSGNLLAALQPVHARIEIFEGQTTVYNFGDESSAGASIHGYTNLSLNLGQMGFAILSLPGSEHQLDGVNFTNPIEWFSGNSSLASAIMDVRPLGADGSFAMESLPEGSYVLSILTASPGQLFSGGADLMYQEMVDVRGTSPIELQIDIP